jgi:energy-coupling factor transporter ATP-binding protein EcfA2
MKPADHIGGNPSLDGWHYQCDVSVFAALDLLVVNRVAKVLQLEPATQEDLEAELHAPRVSSSTVVDGERLVVQAKLRCAGQWTPASLRDLVEHGKRRPSALKLLEDTRVRYVLFTSADVSGTLGALQVDALLERPGDDDLPADVFPATHVKASAGRFAVLAQYNEARVVEKIDAYLLSPLGIPRERHDACREELRKVAMAGMRTGYAWPRGDVEAIIKRHGGSIPSERDHKFVAPTNWGDIVAQMDKRNAIVITGPSGTGKTTVAKALYQHYRSVVPGISYVEPEGPGELRARPDAGPTFFYVEDPWGKYEIGTNTAAWTAELQERLLKANAQQKIVVTSRTDILAATVGSQSDFLKQWEVRLEAKHYGDKELGRMFEELVRRLCSSILQMAAIRAKERVLQTLRTPFEIDRFVALLQAGASPADEDEDEFVSRILHDTQTRAIENEVEWMVRARHYEKAAVVVWGLIAARRGLRRQDLPTIRRAISKLDPAFGLGLESLVNDLVAGGSLRQPSSDVTYTHPRVEQGLLRVVRANTDLTEVTLEHLMTALARMGSTGNSQAVETAVRLHAFIKDFNESLYEVPHEVQLAIDAWLEDALSKDHDDYVGLLRLACIAGSSVCIPAEVARWFRPVTTGKHFFTRSWKLSNRSDDWYERVRNHPLTHDVCERFIRLVLTVETRDYPRRMAEYLDTIASGLDAAWVDAAKMIVHLGERSTAIAVGFGAMRAIENREMLLQLALAELRKVVEAQETYSDPEHWPSIDGHFNDDWEPYDDHTDYFYAAREMVSAFAEATRSDSGWQALTEHEDVRALASEWFDAMEAAVGADAGDDELRRLLELGEGEYLEQRIWRLLTTRWRPSFIIDLRERLRVGHQSAHLREIAARCALEHAPDLLSEVAKELFDEGKTVRLLELAHDAKTHTKRFGDTDSQHVAYNAFELRLPEPFDDLAAALTPLDDIQEVQLTETSLDALIPLLGKHQGPLRPLLIWLAATNGRATEDVLEEALGESLQAEEADMVVRAAAAAGCWRLVRSALTHPRAKARQRALNLLATTTDQEIIDDIVALTNDPSAFVRRSLLDLLAQQPERHAAALVTLCEDTWSLHSVPEGEEQDFPLARVAARALALLPVVPSELTGAIVEAALETDDLTVTEVLLNFLVERGDEDALREVINLVFTFKPTWASVQAASAIARTKRNVPADSVRRADPRWLGKSNYYLAAQTVEAVGSIADNTQILATAKALAVSEGRRVLLIPLAIGAERQSADLANEVLSKLPPGHPAVQVLDTSKHPLPHDALDQLGNARTVEAVHWLLGARIVERPSVLVQ